MELNPLPQTLQIMPGHISEKPVRLIIEETDKHWGRKHSEIHYTDASGRPAARFGYIEETRQHVHKSLYSIQDEAKSPICVIRKKTKSKGLLEFTAIDAQGQALWIMNIERHSFSTSKYELRIFPETPSQQVLELRRNFNGEKQMAIIANGQPAAVFGKSGRHWKRQDAVHVAPNADITLAIGVAFVHYVNQDLDSRSWYGWIGDMIGNCCTGQLTM